MVQFKNGEYYGEQRRFALSMGAAVAVAVVGRSGGALPQTRSDLITKMAETFMWVIFFMCFYTNTFYDWLVGY